MGNLVCPTSYDLGEACKIVLLSVTEGEEKPLKYPGIFFKSELMLLTKIDLLPYVPFNIGVAIANARTVHPEIQIARLSCTTKQGLDEWLRWIDARVKWDIALRGLSCLAKPRTLTDDKNRSSV